MDAGRLTYSINGAIKANLQQENTALDFHKQPFVINETTGDIITNILFQPSWKGTFEIPVAVKDLAEHSASVMAIVSSRILETSRLEVSRILSPGEPAEVRSAVGADFRSASESGVGRSARYHQVSTLQMRP